MSAPGSMQAVSAWRFGLRRLLRHKLQLGLALWWSAVFVLVPMQVPVITGALIDSLRSKEVHLYGVTLSPKSRHKGVRIAAVALLAVALARGLSAYRRQVSVNKLSRRFVRHIRQSLIERLSALSLEDRIRIGPGRLFHCVMADTANLRSFAGQVIVGNATHALRFICPVILMFLHQAWLTSVCCAVIAAQWGVTLLLHRQTREARIQARRTRNRFTTLIQEQLDGAETIQCLGACEVAAGRASRKARRLENEELAQADCEARKSGVIWAMTSVGFALAWGLGGLRVLAGHMTTGELVAFTGLLAFAFAPFRRIAGSMGTSRRVLTSLAHVQELLQLRPGLAEQPNARCIEVQDGCVELRTVSFAYDSVAVVKDLRLVIPPRSITALAGRSGSGKTTLLRLINRLHDPQTGQVLIDNADIRQFSVASLRSSVVLVPQRPMVFSGTIAQNLRLAKPGAEDEALLEACAAADLLQFVEGLDEGLQTRLGRRGIQLSGGEAQRLAIARAVLMRSRILLLDEPTSALDMLSQATIMDTLERLKKQMTIVVAAHRIEALRQADHLVLLEQGRIVEQGCPEKILASPRLCRSLAETLEEEQTAPPLPTIMESA